MSLPYESCGIDWPPGWTEIFQQEIRTTTQDKTD